MQAVPGEVELLVRQMRDAASPQQQASAAHALVAFCAKQEYSKEWLDAGGRAGVPAALVQAAKIADAALQTDAVSALGNLLANHSANKDAAAAAGAIPLILQLAKSSDAALQKKAVSALGHLETTIDVTLHDEAEPLHAEAELGYCDRVYVIACEGQCDNFREAVFHHTRSIIDSISGWYTDVVTGEGPGFCMRLFGCIWILVLAVFLIPFFVLDLLVSFGGVLLWPLNLGCTLLGIITGGICGCRWCNGCCQFVVGFMYVLRHLPEYAFKCIFGGTIKVRKGFTQNSQST